MKIAVWEPVQAHREMMTVIWPTLKSMLMAGHKMTIEIKQSRRSTEQNAMFHSLIGKISRQHLDGRRLEKIIGRSVGKRHRQEDWQSLPKPGW